MFLKLNDNTDSKSNVLECPIINSLTVAPRNSDFTCEIPQETQQCDESPQEYTLCNDTPQETPPCTQTPQYVETPLCAETPIVQACPTENECIDTSVPHVVEDNGCGYKNNLKNLQHKLDEEVMKLSKLQQDEQKKVNCLEAEKTHNIISSINHKQAEIIGTDKNCNIPKCTATPPCQKNLLQIDGDNTFDNYDKFLNLNVGSPAVSNAISNTESIATAKAIDNSVSNIIQNVNTNINAQATADNNGTATANALGNTEVKSTNVASDNSTANTNADNQNNANATANANDNSLAVASVKSDQTTDTNTAATANSNAASASTTNTNTESIANANQGSLANSNATADEKSLTNTCAVNNSTAVGTTNINTDTASTADANNQSLAQSVAESKNNAETNTTAKDDSSATGVSNVNSCSKSTATAVDAGNALSTSESKSNIATDSQANNCSTSTVQNNGGSISNANSLSKGVAEATPVTPLQTEEPCSCTTTPLQSTIPIIDQCPEKMPEIIHAPEITLKSTDTPCAVEQICPQPDICDNVLTKPAIVDCSCEKQLEAKPAIVDCSCKKQLEEIICPLKENECEKDTSALNQECGILKQEEEKCKCIDTDREREKRERERLQEEDRRLREENRCLKREKQEREDREKRLRKEEERRRRKERKLEERRRRKVFRLQAELDAERQAQCFPVPKEELVCVEAPKEEVVCVEAPKEEVVCVEAPKEDVICIDAPKIHECIPGGEIDKIEITDIPFDSQYNKCCVSNKIQKDFDQGLVDANVKNDPYFSDEKMSKDNIKEYDIRCNDERVIDDCQEICRSQNLGAFVDSEIQDLIKGRFLFKCKCESGITDWYFYDSKTDKSKLFGSSTGGLLDPIQEECPCDVTANSLTTEGTDCQAATSQDCKCGSITDTVCDEEDDESTGPCNKGVPGNLGDCFNYFIEDKFNKLHKRINKLKAKNCNYIKDIHQKQSQRKPCIRGETQEQPADNVSCNTKLQSAAACQPLKCGDSLSNLKSDIDDMKCDLRSQRPCAKDTPEDIYFKNRDCKINDTFKSKLKTRFDDKKKHEDKRFADRFQNNNRYASRDEESCTKKPIATSKGADSNVYINDELGKIKKQNEDYLKKIKNMFGGCVTKIESE